MLEDEYKERVRRFISDNPYLIVFILILALGAVLRFNNLGGAPFWKTEIYNSWAARNFIQGLGFSDAVGPSSSYYRALITTSFPIAVSFLLFGINEFAARLPSVLVGLVTVMTCYLLGKEVGGRKLALIYSAFMAVDYWVITWHTQARMYAHNQFLYLLTLLLFLRWYSRDRLSLKSRYLISLVPVALLGVHNHISFIGIGSALGAFIGLSLIWELDTDSLEEDFKNNRFLRNHVFWIILGGVGGLAFLLVNGLPFPFFNYSPDWYNHVRGPLYYLRFLADQSMYIFFFGAGLILSVRHKRLWLILLAFLIPFGVQSLLLYFKIPRMIFHLYPLYLMISAVPVVYTINAVDYFTDRDYSLILTILAISIMITTVFSPVNTFEEMQENSHGAIGLEPDYRGPSNFISGRMSKDDIILSSSPALSAWYLGGPEEVDYNLNPENNKRIDGELVDPRSGTYGIRNGREASRIIENSSGWVIAGTNFKYKTDRDIKEVIVRKSDKTISRWTQVTVYRFNND